MLQLRCVQWSLVAVLVMASVAIIGIPLVRGAGDDTKDINSMAELIKRIEDLEKRIETLEKTQRISTLDPSAATVAPPQRIAPDNATPFQFNGQTIYFIPTHTAPAFQAK